MIAMDKKPLYLLDSGAILNDAQFRFREEDKYLATPRIVDEMRDFRSRMLVESAIKYSLLEVREPAESSLQRAKQEAEKLGLTKLSEADFSIIALAWELRRQPILVITDDYSVQNVLSVLGIAYAPVLMEGISSEIYFQKSCPVCAKEYPKGSTETECENCGAKLKYRRKALKRPKGNITPHG